MPELKDVQIEDTLTCYMDAPDAVERFVQIDNKLKEMKARLKTLKHTADMTLENTKLQYTKVSITLGATYIS